MKITCRDCGNTFDHNARGRPPVRCAGCKGKSETKKLADDDGLPPDSAAVIIATAGDEDFLDEIVAERTAINPDFPKMMEAASKGETLGINLKEEVVNEPSQQTPMYEVVVTNMGTAYAGDNANEAEGTYKRFVKQSTEGFGQCGFEKVSFFHKGGLIKKFRAMPGGKQEA